MATKNSDRIYIGKKAKVFIKKITRSPQTALKFLQDAGILTKTGRLTKHYQ